MEAAVQDNVIYMKRPKRFTLEEAKEILPRVKAFTESVVGEALPLIDQLQDKELPRKEREELSRTLQEMVDEWVDGISCYGALAKGLWIVDFDSGSGYYCWHFGEEELGYFHGYEDDFTKREPIG